MDLSKDLIECSLVHKTDANDVLIYKPEIVLKSVITQSEYESLLIRSAGQKQLIDSVYCIRGGVYVLRTLPSSIAQSVSASKLSDISLEDFYVSDENGMLNILPEYVPLHVEETLRRRLSPDTPPIPQAVKERISALSNDAVVNSYMLLNNTKDLYFYKKNHEHIPGMMLIEAARQAVYDYVYKYSGYEFRSVSISMSKIDVGFFSYSISSYPVEILFSHRDKVRRVKPKKIEKQAWFYQRGRLTGTFYLEGGIIPMTIFPQMRNEKYPKEHLFFPFKDNRYVETLDANLNVLRLRVISLSLGCVTVAHDEINQLREITCLTIGGVTFPMEGYSISSDNRNELSIELGPLSKAQKLLINNIINTHYYHKDTFELAGLPLPN
ncbi:MAG: AfsA-related hotdog domain-containing protein [Pseudomonadota bacterium]